MKIIRDTLYDYIPISTVEEELLKQPELLRLHKILQNSTLYQTYPNNRATRFSHSIGAMHVAGSLFKSLILNSNKDYVRQIHSVTVKFIKRVRGENALEQARDYLLSLFRANEGKGDFYSQYGWNMRNDEFLSPEAGDSAFFFNTVNNILFQAIRLSALVHDIGHPPYSHVIEFPLTDLSIGSKRYFNTEIASRVAEISEKYLTVLTDKLIRPDGDKKLAKAQGFKPGELHEMMGILIIDNIFKHRKLEQSITLTDAFFSICLRLCIQILTLDQLGHYLDEQFVEWSSSEEAIRQEVVGFYSLGNIVSGPIDCDRLDFLRRDPINSGVPEFGRVDATRIIAGIELVNPKPRGLLDRPISQRVLVPGFSRQSISALTEFFYERQKQNRWLRDHHNVVRTDLALSRLVLEWANLLEKKPVDPICEILKSHNLPLLWRFDLSHLSSSYRMLDDSWLENALNNIKMDLENLSTENSKKRQVNGRDLDYSLLLLRVLLDRNYQGFKTIWKRRDSFQEFADGFREAAISEIESVKKRFAGNRLVKSVFQNKNKGNAIQFTNYFLLLFREVVKGKTMLTSPYSVMLEIEQILNHAAPNLPVHFALKSDSSYKGVSVLLNQANHASPKIMYLDEISSLVASLEQININDVRLYGYQLNFENGTQTELPPVVDLGRKTGKAVLSLVLGD